MSASQSTILVVEDEPLIRVLLTEALQDEGYRVLAASSVLEAIGHIARHQTIDGLVTDVDLPGGLNGLDLMKLFSDCRPDAARIVVSGRSDLEETKLPARCRMFAKPYSFDAVIAELEFQMGGKNVTACVGRAHS